MHAADRSTADLVVAGGGVIGLAIAWRAAQAGLRVVLADDRPVSGSSFAAAGMLAPVTEVHYGEEALLRLNLASAERYGAFVAELEDVTGLSTGYRAAGTLLVARDRDDKSVLDDLYDFQVRLGLPVRRLRSQECRALEPSLAPSVRGGVLAEGDHRVDNRALAAALAEAGRRVGVVHEAARVAEVLGGARVSGVMLTGGREIATRQVVVAAGWGSAGIGGLPPGALPVRPVKGQLLYLRGPMSPPLLSRTVRGLDAYLVPRDDGRVVVGATVEERGADLTVRAGAVHELLRAAWELVPGMDELELAETVVGLRPGTPDNAPLLGPMEPEGVIAATGHYRNGILLTPVTAETVTETLVTGTAPDLIAPFSPLRFAAVAR